MQEVGDEEAKKRAIDDAIDLLSTKAKNIKSQEALDRFSADVGRIATELQIPFPSSLIEIATQSVTQHNTQKAAVEDAQAVVTAREKEAAAYEENQVRENSLKSKTEKYNSFKADFHKQLKDENTLLERAVQGEQPLTDKEKDRFNGKYSSKEEEEEAKRKEEEMVRRCILHDEIDQMAQESILYRQKRIQENDELRNRPGITQDARDMLDRDSAMHQHTIDEHRNTLLAQEPANQERERHRQLISAAVDKGQHALASEHLKRHHIRYKRRYDRKRQEDPNHIECQEFEALVKKFLTAGLPIPEDLIPKQQGAASQSIQRATEKHDTHASTNVINRDIVNKYRVAFEPESQTKHTQPTPPHTPSNSKMSAFLQRGNSMLGKG